MLSLIERYLRDRELLGDKRAGTNFWILRARLTVSLSSRRVRRSQDGDDVLRSLALKDLLHLAGDR